MRFGPLELIIILVIVILVFGVGRLPEVGGAIGKGIREFRKSMRGEDELEQKEPKAVTDASKESKKS